MSATKEPGIVKSTFKARNLLPRYVLAVPNFFPLL